MARPKKRGLQYFSVDTDIWDSDSMQMLTAKLQTKGAFIMIRLLSQIYRNCYFIPWDTQQKYLFMSRCPGDITQDDVEWAVYALIDTGFFSKDMYMTYGILTSQHIQRRYFMAVDYRKVQSEEWPYLMSFPKKNQGFPQKNPEFSAEIESEFSAEKPEFSADLSGVSLRKTSFPQKNTSFPQKNDSSPYNPYLKKRKENPPYNPPVETEGREEREISSSNKINGTNKTDETNGINSSKEDGEMGRYEEGLATLTPEQQKMAQRLDGALTDLGVKEGMRHRLAGVSHFGELGNPIWGHIFRLRTETSLASKIKDKGTYLYTCMTSGR